MEALRKNWLLLSKKLIVNLIGVFCFLVQSSNMVKGQPGCTPTTTPGDLFYPNTVSTPTFFTNGVQYLCGPNTIVYDTISNPNGLRVYVNTGSTLFFNKGYPLGPATNIWLKNSSTLNLVGVNGYPLNIYYEPGAIINNSASVITSSTMCSNIIFPVVNCSTGINEDIELLNSLKIYPNPVSNTLYLSNEKYFEEEVQIEIVNCLGQTVLKLSYKNEVDISGFSSGCYTLKITTSNKQLYHSKFIKE